LGRDLQNPPSVVFTGYPGDKVVSITDQEGLSRQPWVDLLLEPFVQHIV
jgi:hypothetical protein